MTSFDYIVVGAGQQAPSWLPGWRNQPANRVLLIEAGGSHKHMNVQVPVAFSKKSPRTCRR